MNVHVYGSERPSPHYPLHISKQIRSAVKRDEYLPVKERNDVAMAVDGIERGYLTWLI